MFVSYLHLKPPNNSFLSIHSVSEYSSTSATTTTTTTTNTTIL